MDYQQLGLKCGIEIHQQLEGKKLFCACPTIVRDDAPDFTIQRRLRASAGEQGDIDVAAQEEQLKSKNFVYEGYEDSTCLVELDCEPPHALNEEALYTALQFSRLVDASISPVIQVMRKTVVDGSNTSGFQRTALIGRNGYVETSQGKVGITNLSLEEDSPKIIANTAEEKRYRLDRLGIPLIEIGTAPDIVSAQQCQETAKKLGLLLRSLPGIKRGLGTIRQDVNVSIAGGTRIEIKGVQDLRQVALFVELEVKRQVELLKLKEEIKERRLNPLEIIDLTKTLSLSTSKIVVKTLQQKGKVLGMKVDGFAGLLGRELQPGYRVGTELSGRAKIKAGVGGIFHSDELPNYSITAEEVKKIRRELKCAEKDAFVLVADQEVKAQKALKAAHTRVEELWSGVPKEVRQPNANGTTSFLRSMPGAARMYPETDIPLVYPNLKEIALPELLEEKIKRYQEKLGLSKDLAEFVAMSDKVELFEDLLEKHSGIKPAFMAEVLTSMLVDIKRAYHLDAGKLTDDHFREVFRYLEEGKIHKDIVVDVLEEMITGKFNLKKYEGLSTEELHKELMAVIHGNKGAPFSALMGEAVKKLAGRASGEKISQHLKMLLEQGHK